MRMLHKFEKYSVVILALIIFTVASGCGTAPAATELPVTEEPASTEEPISSLDFDQIDHALRESVTGSIAYNAPHAMRLNETATIELLLNPSVEPTVLATQVSEEGEVITASIQVTPRMKAVLIPQGGDTFFIQPIHDNPEQPISTTETTKWSWDVTAHKAGRHRLTLVIYRLITVDGSDNWRVAQEYRSDIEVEVTLVQRLLMLDWKWIAVVIAIALLIPAFWRWYDQRRQKDRRKSPNLTRESPLSRLTRISKVGSPSHENLGHIFISYRRSDSADIAGRIYDRLVDHFGPNPIFKDVDSIPLGVDFKEYLDKKVSECNVLLAIIGDRWIDASDESGKKRLEDPDDFVRIEIESALERGIPVIPLLVRGAQMPVDENLPLSLRKLVYQNGIQIRPDPDFHHDMERLISALGNYI